MLVGVQFPPVITDVRKFCYAHQSLPRVQACLGREFIGRITAKSLAPYSRCAKNDLVTY